MAAAKTNIALIYTANAIIKINKTVRSQNIELCDNDNDSDNTDEKYIDPDLCDLLDVLAALIKTRSKQKLNAKNKNQQIVQERIKKKKRYPIPKILRREEYIDAP